MPVYAITSRVLDGTGNVAAVTTMPFLVLAPGEDTAQAEAELERVKQDLETMRQELEAARTDETHPHHHWWRL